MIQVRATAEQSGIDVGATDPDADYLALLQRLDLRLGATYDRNWSAAPDFLGLIVDHTLTTRPTTIVECGSGITTLLLARCLEINRHGRLYSLENGVEYATRTRAELARYHLDANVIDAPLKPCRIDGREHLWYDSAGLPDLKIDMLVIDGPPGSIQRHARYPALPRLGDKLAETCTIFLDDAGREDERGIVALWQARFPALRHDYVGTQRGCSILRQGPST